MRCFYAFLLTLCIPFSSSYGMYSASPPNEIRIESISFLNESGKTTTITEIPHSESSLVLIPGYFQCHASCPILADQLKKMVDGVQKFSKFRFLFLSFDPKDEMETMKMFRSHHQLPSTWLLGVITDQSFAKEFFAQFQYSFQKTDFGFDHPNTAFVFSPKSLIWTGSLFGGQILALDLVQAYRDANLANQTGLSAGFSKFLGKKEYLMLYGLIITVLSLGYVFFFFSKRRRLVSKG